MKPNGYRSPYIKKKRTSYLVIIRLILVIVLCASLVYILFKEKIDTIFETGLPAHSEQTLKPSDTPKNGAPVITLNLDGRNYVISASEVLSETSAPITTAFQEIGVGKNSKLQITFDNPPDNFNIQLYKEDEMVLSEQNPTIPAEDIPGDGEYYGICEASWNTGEGFKGDAVYQFTLVADFPPKLTLSSSEIDPGELLVLCVENLNDDQKLEIETDLDYKPRPFKFGNKHIILLPVSYYNEVSKIYQIKVNMGDETLSYAIKVKDKAFTTQYMTIDTKVAAETRNDKSAQEVVDKINPLKPISDGEPYWTGKFIMPVEGGRVTETDFGKRRYVNKAPTSYRHNGLDIGHDKGTPVMASNNGRVLLAEFLIGTGNTIILEHGFGLKSWYYHMDELSVKTGNQVKQGQIIGKVGSTGFSTGPHLHFSTSVNGVFVNPITLINEGVPLLVRD